MVAGMTHPMRSPARIPVRCMGNALMTEVKSLWNAPGSEAGSTVCLEYDCQTLNLNVYEKQCFDSVFAGDAATIVHQVS
jgi:hypothetical protein